MTKMLEPMVNEIQQEAVATRRVLERVPADKLSWKPHPKSMSIGQLALDIASIPGGLSKIAQLDELTPPTQTSIPLLPKTRTRFSPRSRRATGCARLSGQHQRIDCARKLAANAMLNHWYHHRGQLSVYLRLLDVPVPVIYGRSADESPFD